MNQTGSVILTQILELNIICEGLGVQEVWIYFNRFDVSMPLATSSEIEWLLNRLTMNTACVDSTDQPVKSQKGLRDLLKLWMENN